MRGLETVDCPQSMYLWDMWGRGEGKEKSGHSLGFFSFTSTYLN